MDTHLGLITRAEVCCCGLMRESELGMEKNILYVLPLLLLYLFNLFGDIEMKSSKRCSQLPISVLNLPPKNLLISAPSPSCEYQLYHEGSKKMCIEAYRTSVQKAKLFSNLEIYEWRNQTEFPIVKTKYISIQPNNLQSTHIIELIVYNEHCPLKLNRIYEMNLAQTLYILKESIIGFERLYNRFGPFEVRENMIAINEKGFCRVWLNENFAINGFAKGVDNEAIMVEQIQEIMEKHCQQSKSSRKLFAKLRLCKTFLSAMKEVDILAIGSKMLVPSKFLISSTSCKDIRVDNFKNLMRTDFISQQNIRYSIVSGKIKNNKTEEAKEQNAEINFSMSNSPNNQNSPNSSNTPNEIKRFKSLSKIKVGNLMKISDGETAYTRNYKETKCSNLGNSPRETNEKTVRDHSKKKVRKWLQDSSFVMELQDDSKKSKDKKEMSYSTDIVIQGQERGKDRKFSANIGSQKPDNLFYRFQNSAKQNQRDPYTNQFKSVLDNDAEDESICTPRSKIVEVDEEKFKDDHMDTIMKNNGWNGISGFLVPDAPVELNQSFQEGQDENNLAKEIKLHKLDSIGKRPIALSIMPAQYEDII